MNLRAVWLFVLAAPIATALSAKAQPSDQPMQIMPDFESLRPPAGEPIAPDKAFKVLDANRDGQVDAAEWRERKMALFYLFDDNRDLYLSRGELPRMAPAVFDAADTDGDGRMSGYEFNQASFAQFASVDRDSNETITLDEFKAHVEALREPS
jgi:Ca2+-binding EF-hand superfamily protein